MTGEPFPLLAWVPSIGRSGNGSAGPPPTRLARGNSLSPASVASMIRTHDLPAIEIAHRMFARWRQENFFKYLREEYALDALVDYAVVPDDPARDVPNPRWATPARTRGTSSAA
jgi:hypothetical protein